MFPANSQNGVLCTRRLWLKAAGALTIGTTLARSLRAAAEGDAPAGAGGPAAAPQPAAGQEPGRQQASLIQIGILLGTFPQPTLEAKLDAVKACGLDCIQLSMDRAGLSPLPNEVPPEISGRIRREAAARGITIASLQGTLVGRKAPGKTGME
jgi:hypothetical protein